MAACIVCNQQTLPDDLQDVGDMVSLWARLEKVLDEDVPQASVMCSSCQFDLTQIEMYYTLLTVFKKRYSETAKQRLQSLDDYPSRNLLQETTYSSSNNLELRTSVEISSPDIKLEIHNVRTVKEELQADKSSPLETTNENFGESLSDLPQEHGELVKTLGQSQLGQKLPSASGEAVKANTWPSYIDEPQPVGFPAGVPRKCGRLAKKEPNVSSAGVVASPRKRGRPRKSERPSQDMAVSLRKRGKPPKTEQPSAIVSAIPLEVSAIGKKKRGRTRKNAAPIDTVHESPVIPKKRGRPKKDETSELVATEGDAVHAKKRGQPKKAAAMKVGPTKNKSTTKDRPIRFKDSESEESSLGEHNTDVSDTDDPPYDTELSKRPSLSPGTLECLKEEEIKSEASSVSVEDSESITSQETVADGASSAKKKRDGARKEGSPSYTPVASTSVGRNKGGRPKKGDNSPRPTHTCPICDKVCNKVWYLKMHMKTHTEERPHVCSICSKAFRGIGELNAHMKIHDEARPFKCEICGKGFIRITVLKRHAVVHTDKKPYPCDQCEKRFKCQDYLKLHVKFHHVDGRKYLCSICGYAVFTESALKVHVAKHSGCEEKLWKCNTCGKAVRTKHQLQSHELSHKADYTRERHLCPYCGKALLSKYYLGLHVAQHTGTVKHSCIQCDSTFLTSSAYRKHMMIHRGETPFSCSECGKGFRNATNLKLHMMMHTDTRPFVCTCGQAFRQKVKLQRHLLTRKHAESEAKRVNSQSSNIPVGEPVELPAAVATASVATASVSAAPVATAAPPPIVPPLFAEEPLPMLVVPAIFSQEELSPECSVPNENVL